MNVRMLSPEYGVAEQIQASDLPALAEAGFRSVICNRPDGESAGQPGFAEIAEAAQRAGLQASYLPAVSGQVNETHGRELARLLQTLPAPVLAYCRSGARSTVIWQIAQSLQGGGR